MSVGLPTALMAVVLLGPLAAAVLHVSGGGEIRQRRVRWTATAMLIAATAAACGLLVAVDGSGPDSLRADLYTWAAVGGADPMQVGVGLRCDRLAAVLLLNATLAASLLVVVAGGGSNPENGTEPASAAVMALLHLVAACGLLLSASAVLLLLFWQLTSQTAAVLIGSQRRDAAATAAASKLWLWSSAGDVLCLIGVGFLWLEFHTLDLEAALLEPERLAAVIQRNPAALNLLCASWLAGAAVRCGQVPWFGWLRGAAGAPAVTLGLLQSAVLMPAAVYVLLRLSPLLVHAREACVLMGAIGSGTALLAGASAAAATDLKQVLSFSSASQLGVALAAIATGTPAGMAAGVYLLLGHAAAKALMYASTAEIERRTTGETRLEELAGLRQALPVAWGSMAAGLLVVASGLWGPLAVLNVLETSADAAGPLGAGDTRLIFWLCLGGLVLHAFALGRVFFGTLRGAAAGARELPLGVLATGGTAGSMWTATVLGAMAILLGPVWGSRAEWWTAVFVPAAEGSAAEGATAMFVWRPEGIAMAAAWGLAWAVSTRRRAQADRSTAGSHVLVRLCRNAFYLDDCLRYSVIVPVKVCGYLCRLADRFVVDSGLLGALRLLPSLAVRWGNPLRGGPVQLWVLACGAFAAGLLAAALGLAQRWRAW